MKNGISKKNLKIIAATAMTIFSLFAATAGAYAWFTSRLNEAAEGDMFEVANVDTSVEEISIHTFYGTTTEAQEQNRYYGFNPVPVGYINFNNHLNPTRIGTLSVTLENYLLEDPHHPVLLLFKVNGANQTIVGKTEYPFLSKEIVGPQTLGSNYIVANHAALLAKQSSAVDGDIYEVTNDDYQNAIYDDSTKVKARYQYHAETDSFERVWVDLGSEDNPLSSVIQTHSFEFSFTRPFNVNGNTLSINSESTALSTKTYKHSQSDEQTQTSSGIWIPVRDFKERTDANTNLASFVTIDNEGDATFQNEATLFNGSVSGDSYVAIVVDYYPDALVYFSSYYMGHQYLNEDVTFKCDWTIMV